MASFAFPKRDVFRLIFLKQGLGIVEDDCRRQQVLLRTQLRTDDRAVEAAEVQPRGVADDLGAKGRFAAREPDGIEIAGRSDVADEQLRLGDAQDRLRPTGQARA